MTREKAIETLKLLKPNMRFDNSGWLYTKQAVDMAIKALEQEPCENCEVGNPCLYCKHDFEHQMCKDCIHAEIYSATAMKCVKRNEIVFTDGRCSKFEKKTEQI